MAPSEVEEDVRSLRDQPVAVLQEWRGKGWVRTGGFIHQPLHRRDPAGKPRDIDIFGADVLQCETVEFSGPLIVGQ
jgi:hypothetical protein